MKIRLSLAAVCIFFLPVWSSPTLGEKPTYSTPFALVAFAGHTTSGGRYCDCGTDQCICDSGEVPMPAQSQNTPSDVGSESLLILAAIMLWLRLRA